MPAPPDRPPANRSVGVRRSVRRLLRIDGRRLWTLALAALVLDVALTVLGLHVGLVEANPVAVASVRVLGVLGGLVTLKAAAVAVALVGRAVLPPEYRTVVPLALAVPWWAAVVANTVQLAIAL